MGMLRLVSCHSELWLVSSSSVALFKGVGLGRRRMCDLDKDIHTDRHT